MKQLRTNHIVIFLALVALTLDPEQAGAQNVGIGTNTPLEKLHVIGNVRSSTLAGVGTRQVLADPNGTLITGTGLNSPSWLVDGNSGLSGGTLTTAGTNFLGTLDAQNVCIRTNNIERVRISALGEFFVGTFNTVIPGDLMNAVGNNTFPWAVNGYVPAGSNGGGVFGNVQTGNATLFASVQGEYAGTNPSGAGVRGIAITPISIGVQGQEPSLLGWAGLFNGDVGSTGTYYLVSDRKVKKDIAAVSNALDLINGVNVYTYHYDTERYSGFGFSKNLQYGLMADEVSKVIPSAVASKSISSGDLGRTTDPSSFDKIEVDAVNYMVMVPLLIQGMKEQQQMIEEMQQRIDDLESQLNK